MYWTVGEVSMSCYGEWKRWNFETERRIMSSVPQFTCSESTHLRGAQSSTHSTHIHLLRQYQFHSLTAFVLDKQSQLNMICFNQFTYYQITTFMLSLTFNVTMINSKYSLASISLVWNIDAATGFVWIMEFEIRTTNGNFSSLLIVRFHCVSKSQIFLHAIQTNEWKKNNPFWVQRSWIIFVTYFGRYRRLLLNR